MKKTAKMLPLVIAASTVLIFSVMLASCGQNAAESGKTETEQSGESEIETALPKGAKLVGTLGGEEIYAEEVGKEIIPQRFFDNDGKPYVENQEISVYKLLDSKGRYITEHPVEDHFFIEPDSLTNYSVYAICCTYKGDFYEYERQNGEYVLSSVKEHAPIGKGFGYQSLLDRTVYYWNADPNSGSSLGLIDWKGNQLTEPIYAHFETYFNDRVAAYYGKNYTDALNGDGALEIMDYEGNILSSSYNRVKYAFFDDGSYVGIGWCKGEKAAVVCRDEDGEICEEGMWFIDRDGNKLSEKISINMKKFFDFEYITDPETEIEITTADGKKVVVRLKDYAIKE